jgi:integrase
MLYVYLLGMATIGCRRSELLAITAGDLDLDNGFVTIRASIADGGPGRGTYRTTTKRDDWRDVPLTEQMVETFRELLDRRRALLRDFVETDVRSSSYVFSDDPEVRHGYVRTRRANAGWRPAVTPALRSRCFEGMSPRNYST